MEIHYSDNKTFDPDQLAELFLSVQWTSGNYPERLVEAMQGSHSVLSAWDSDRLVGLINCLSDGVMTAYIHYLLVRPEYQGRGIGRALLQMMTERYSECLRKVLIADNEQVGFYTKCGFVTGGGTAALFLDIDSDMTREIE